MLSDSIEQRIQDFRRSRIADLSANQTPIKFFDTSKLILHLIPLESFASRTSFEANHLKSALSDGDCGEPMGDREESGWGVRVNLNGCLSKTILGGNESNSYIQVYRNGIIEAVRGSTPPMSKSEQKLTINCAYYERLLVTFLPKYLSMQKKLNLHPPIYMFVTLMGIQGHSLIIDNSSRWSSPSEPIRQDILILPEVVVESYEVNPATILKPVFDLICNAFGLLQSPNFDAHGRWTLSH